MAKKKNDSPVFEIFVVLAIVAIVAVTGQVLVNMDKAPAPKGFGSDEITGFAVAEYEEEVEDDFLDLGVREIVVNPPTPIIGESFKVLVRVENKGFTPIKTPFYVELKLMPRGNLEPSVFTSVVTEILEPGRTSSAVFNMAAVTSEGPMKIIATADSTAKLPDDNPSNDRRSKTVIITSQ